MMPESAADQRGGLVPGRDVHTVKGRLMKVAPDGSKFDIHHWPVLRESSYARREPDDPQCPIRDLCRFKEEKRRPEDAAHERKAAGRGPPLCLMPDLPANQKRNSPQTPNSLVSRSMAVSFSRCVYLYTVDSLTPLTTGNSRPRL